jgi:hypothetical protein
VGYGVGGGGITDGNGVICQVGSSVGCGREM